MIDDLWQGMILPEASHALMIDETVVRCYLLLSNGIQLGATITSEAAGRPSPPTAKDLRFQPLQDARSADWFRRHYLRLAIVHPEQLQITRPYLSITGAHLCVTLSMMFAVDDGYRVFCCDLNWDASKKQVGGNSAFTLDRVERKP